jgi:hypothetical protein
MKRQLFICLLLLTVALAAKAALNYNNVTIGGLRYNLYGKTNTAIVLNGNTWEGELVIPEQVRYANEIYTVDQIQSNAFLGCKTLTKVRIPKTVNDIVSAHVDGGVYKNPFCECTSLERIEVDEDNPSLCSVDGVLFNKDRTMMYAYPGGARNESYIVPDGVIRLLGHTFSNNPYLTSVFLPNSVILIGSFSDIKSLSSVRLSENLEYVEAYAFENCESLHFLDIPESVKGFGEGVFRWTPFKTIVFRGTYPDGLRKDTFYFLNKSTVIYAQRSEIPKFQSVFSGTVLPLEDYTPDGIATPMTATDRGHQLFDLQGRRVSGQPRTGIYIGADDRRKVLKK